MVPREACACWGQGRSWATQRGGTPSQQTRVWYIYLDLSYQGIKVKRDPKLGGSLITLSPQPWSIWLLKWGEGKGELEGGVGGVVLHAEIMHRTLLWLLAL